MIFTKKKLLACGALVLVIAYASGAMSPLTGTVKGASSQISKSADSLLSSKKASASSTPKTVSPNLVSDLNQDISADGGNNDLAVSVVDLDNNKQYDAGETGVVFKAASTAKLITIVTYLHEVDEGKASLDQQIDGSSAQDLIKQMLEVSDNDAWAAMSNYLGDDEQAYANSIGLTSFTGGDYNTITAADEAKLLTMIYQAKIISTSDRDLMYGYMEVADGKDLIKAALPSSATVYHKYGLLWGNLHDTAIVSYNGRHFALVIYTKNPDNTLDDYSTRLDLIHKLTQTVVSDVT